MILRDESLFYHIRTPSPVLEQGTISYYCIQKEKFPCFMAMSLYDHHLNPYGTCEVPKIQILQFPKQLILSFQTIIQDFEPILRRNPVLLLSIS